MKQFSLLRLQTSFITWAGQIYQNNFAEKPMKLFIYITVTIQLIDTCTSEISYYWYFTCLKGKFIKIYSFTMD